MTVQRAYHLSTSEDPAREKARLAVQARATGNAERDALLEAGIETSQVLLELGCGPNLATGMLAELAPQARIITLDYDQRSLASGGPRRVSVGSRVVPVCGDVTQLPLTPACADFAYMRFLLQHVKDPRAALRQAMSVVGEHGVVCALDGDFGVLTVHPELPAVAHAVALDLLTHSARGGDRRIGRKLVDHFHAAGLVDIQARTVMATSAELGRERFRTLFLDPLLAASPAELQNAARAELDTWVADPRSFALLAGVMAWGRNAGGSHAS
ncbi:MAG: methyltransferase domain-containing protein [Myxococcota bacterium]